MPKFNRKLQGNRIQVLCNLWTLFTIGKCLVHLEDCFDVCDAYGMRVPGVNIFHNELVIDVLEDPVAHLIFANVALDIVV